MDYAISEKKQKQIDELQAKPLVVGDEVYVNLTGEKILTAQHSPLVLILSLKMSFRCGI